MKKLTVKWDNMYPFLAKNNINTFKRMGLCYVDNGTLDKTKPFTVFDFQRNHGGELGFQKEGIQMNIDGNPDNLNFNFETIFI